jgi:mannose-6-phosphate isomerase-like protein (cupin superfamily)
MLKYFVAAAQCLFATAALAQAPIMPAANLAPHARPNDPITLTTLQQWSGKVSVTKANIATAILIDHENFFEEVVYRDGTGSPEQHNHWNDNVIVQEGDATLVYGGTLSGATISANGEAGRGGAITGGQTLEMHPGDLVTIPAGIPHQMVLKPGTHFRFVVIKNRV